MTTPRCLRCGRPLRDPVSIALGMGAECRGGKPRSRRQTAYHNRVSRGQAYCDKTPLVFSNDTLAFDPSDSRWVSSKSGYRSTDEGIQDWLKRNTLAIFPDEYLDSLIIRRHKIEAFLIGPLDHVCEKQIEELRNELLIIQGEIDEIE